MRTLQGLDQLPIQVVWHVLWHFGDTNLGYQPGSFVERLLLSMNVADQENFRRLAEAFPDYARAFTAAKDEDGGLEALRSIAKLVNA